MFAVTSSVSSGKSFSAVLPHLHSCFVERDLNEPGAEFAFCPETPKIRECFENGLLGDFFGIS